MEMARSEMKRKEMEVKGKAAWGRGERTKE